MFKGQLEAKCNLYNIQYIYVSNGNQNTNFNSSYSEMILCLMSEI